MSKVDMSETGRHAAETAAEPIDERYEFAAPQYVDFDNLREDATADKWFEQRRETGVPAPLDFPVFQPGEQDGADPGYYSEPDASEQRRLTRPTKTNYLKAPASPQARQQQQQQQQHGSVVVAMLGEDEYEAKPNSPKRRSVEQQPKATLGHAVVHRSKRSKMMVPVVEPVRAPKRSTSLTQPRPFHFRTTSRRSAVPDSASTASSIASSMGSAAPYESMAESVLKYQTKTPKRFRSRPAPLDTTEVAKRSRPLALTVPVTPKFASKHRVGRRPVAVLSREKREELEVAKMRAHRFKARPVDNRVMTSSGDIGLPKLPKTRPTQPKEFKFRSEERVSKARQQRSTERPSTAPAGRSFKARPVPKPINVSAPPSTAAASRLLTVPESPALMTKQRAQSRPQEPVVAPEPTPEPFHARPVPVGPGFQPQLPHKATKPEPFALASEQRRQQHLKELEAERAAAARVEEEARQFRARPMPVNEGFRPCVEHKATVPQPFGSEGFARHEAAQEEWKQRVEEELQREQERFKSFRAAPIPESTYSPMVPKKSTLPLTEIDDNFAVNSDIRAAQRAAFEKEKAERAAAAERAAKEKEELRLKQEAEEIKRLRQEMSFKARPAPKFPKPFVPRNSSQPLTDPCSPYLRTKSRSSVAPPPAGAGA